MEMFVNKSLYNPALTVQNKYYSQQRFANEAGCEGLLEQNNSRNALRVIFMLMKTGSRWGCLYTSGGMDMTNISELDLQNLRHLIGGFDTTHCKLQEYAKEATDEKVKQFFEKSARSAMDNKQQLMKFLQ